MLQPRTQGAAVLSATPVWARPMPVALFSLVVLTLIGWVVLFAEALARGGGVDAFMEALCAPAAILEARSLGEAAAEMGRAIALWIAMAVAMMLPTASALVVGYAERAEAERAAGRRAVSPLVLAGGYLAVWVAVAIVAALAQTGASVLLASAPLPEASLAVLGGLALGAAGLYQFTAFKRACLVAIGSPFARLGEGWSAHASAVFRVGAVQGWRCVLCCWAMMGVLVAMGAMNLVWMAVFSAIMAAEKTAASARAAQIVGIGLVLAGLALPIWAVGPAAVLTRLLA